MAGDSEAQVVAVALSPPLRDEAGVAAGAPLLVGLEPPEERLEAAVHLGQ